MQLQPYLNFPGTCEEAFRFYEKLFGAKIEAMMRFKGSPAESQCAPEFGDKIMHARLTVDGEVLMASDASPERYQKPQGFSVCIDIKEPARAEALFKGLSEGGHAMMPLQETFFAERFAMLTDRFGIPWIINCVGSKAP